jgi:hypothetical protein
LAGDLAGTATAPTVPGLANKENLSNKSTATSLGTSNDLYPTQNAVKVYVDQATQGIALQAAVDAKADKNSPIFTGTPNLPTGTIAVTQNGADNSTKIATTAFVQAATAAGIIDASSTTKGKLKLAGDLGGTAESPTVPGLALKANSADVTSSLALKEDASNKSTATALGTSDALYPSQKAVKTYVDAQIASATIADADPSTKGKIQLAGDLGGTASSPTVPGLALKAPINNPTFTGTVAGITQGMVGLSNVDNTSDANKPVSTATQTALDLKAPLASPTFTGSPSLPTGTTAITQSAGDNSTKLATTEFVTTKLASGAPDATTTATGKVQLAGDLGGTASAPTVPGLALKANTTDVNSSLALKAPINNPTFTGTVGGINQSMVGLGNVDNTSDANKPVSTAAQTALDLKAPLASPTFTGTPSLPTGTTAITQSAGDNSTKLATTEFVTTKLASGAPDATTTATGKVQLAGDLGGTASAPTVPGLALKANSADVTTSLATKVDKVTGQGLSTNDYTTAEKTKLASAVPYTGATQAVNLGDYDLTVNGITVGRGGGSDESNTVIGKNALVNNTVDNVNYTGIENTAIGFNALSSNTTGHENTAIGLSSLYYNTGGYENTAIGKRSLYRNTTGFWNTANGHNAMESNTTGNKNTASGKSSLYNNTEGSSNTANGYNAMFSNITGSMNTAYGEAAGRYIANGTTGNTTSDFSVYLGSNTKASADNAQNEIVIGYNAIGAGSNTIQLGNTAVTDVKTSGTLTAGTVTYPKAHGTNGQVLSTTGSGTLSWTSIPTPDLTNYVTTNTAQTITASKTFSETTTFSKDAIVNGITVGIGGGNVVNRNTAIGFGALSNNTGEGLNNTAIGSGALSNNTEGDDNTASGYRALRFNITGRFNTASGSSALRDNTSGQYNTAFGLSALQTNGTGSNNTAIGSLADVGSANLTNATAIGYGAVVNADNTIQLGNTDVTNVKTSGTVTASGTVLTSDLRLKSNISPLASSLATVMQLNPVHYMKKSSLASTAYTREENGFIAQEIQKILPFIVTEGTDKNKLLSVDYNSFIPMLTKAIQEQQKQIEDQNSKIAAQQKQIEELIKLVKGQ